MRLFDFAPLVVLLAIATWMIAATENADHHLVIVEENGTKSYAIEYCNRLVHPISKCELYGYRYSMDEYPQALEMFEYFKKPSPPEPKVIQVVK